MGKSYEVLDNKIEAFVTLGNTKIEALTNLTGAQFDALNTRVGELLQYQEISLGLLSLFIIIISYASYKSASIDAKKTAIDEFHKWFKESKKMIDELDKHLEDTYKEVANHKKMFFESVNLTLAQMQGIVASSNEVASTSSSDNSLKNRFDSATSLMNESPEESKRQLHELVEENKDKKDSQAQLVVVLSLLTLGNRSESAGLFSDAKEYFKKIVDLYPDLDDYAVLGLLNYGGILLKSGQLEESIKVLDDLIAQYEKSPSNNVKFAVARAMLNKAIATINSGRAESGVYICDNILAKYQFLDVDDLAKFLCSVYFVQAGSFEITGKVNEAIKVFELIVKRFSSDVSSEINRMVASSKNRLKLLK
jgi:tetratricopeptide (TPR) repeat protein